jgi:porin
MNMTIVFISARLATGILAASLALSAGAEDAIVPAPEDAVAEREHASGDWFGLRGALEDEGVELTLVLQADPSANLSGGLRRGTVVRVPLQAGLDVDAERLLGWRGGRLHAGAQTFDGRNATDELVGDLQGFNNVDAERLRQVSELWLEQRLLGDRLRIKLGKADANADFARVFASGEFLNSSGGYSPTIQGFPTYPDPAMSLSVFGKPAGFLSLGAGLFDGATQAGCHGRTGNRGFGTFFGAPDALFVVGEMGLHFTLGGRPGRLGFGSWKHTGTFERFDGSARRGTTGHYGVFEQRLAQAGDDEDRGLDLFAQLGTSDPGLSEIEEHVSIGLAAKGALRGRPRDVAGVMLSSVRMSARCPEAGARRRETAIEAYYGVQLQPWLIVKPDVQYILNPGARGASNALVATLRTTVSF